MRAGSIIPLGTQIESTSQKQDLAKILVYPGANGEFSLYNDDGKTYEYEKSGGQITRLHWDDAAGKFTHEGAEAWTGPDSALVKVVKR